MEYNNQDKAEELYSDAVKISKNCRHFAMCKIDFLGSGVCASGKEKHYVSFYPEGRMDLYAALSDGIITVTEKCIEIVNSCNLCGKCDYQCYFVNQMRPSKVMKALKCYVNNYVKMGGQIAPPKQDSILIKIKEIVGDYWATNDPAITIAYHHDLCPHVTFKMPKYVIMPNSKAEISSVIKILNSYNIPYVVRGNGASSHGLVFTEGAIIDLNRMKKIEFNEKNWYVKVGPGVSSYEVQLEAHKRGYRVHTAEPASLICANIMTSGILSTFSTTYGISADNYIDAEFIGKDGCLFNLNDINSPNLFAYINSNCDHDLFAICVSVSIKLHPVTDDERGVLVPFESLKEALSFAKDCAIRHIGLAIGILGNDFISTFMSPTKNLATKTKKIFSEKLGIHYLVLVIGDRYALNAICEMGFPCIDQKLFEILYHSLPSLESAPWLDLLNDLSNDQPFSYFNLSQFTELAEIALNPSSAKLTQGIDPDLKPFYEKLYSKPEINNLVWLNTFRIQSSRYGRENPFVSLVCYLPIDNQLIIEIQNKIRNIPDKHHIRNGLGFITPFDSGKRCVWEYDYYFDHTDKEEIKRIKQAVCEAGALLDDYSKQTGTVRQVRYVANRGCCRKENLLYT